MSIPVHIHVENGTNLHMNASAAQAAVFSGLRTNDKLRVDGRLLTVHDSIPDLETRHGLMEINIYGRYYG